jgi:hypothetical protein
LTQEPTETVGVIEERATPGCIGANPIECFEPPSADNRRQGRREDQMPTTVDEQFFQSSRAANVRAADPECLAAGVDGCQHTVPDPRFIDASGARSAKAACGVCFIHNQMCAIAIRKFHKVRQRGAVAIHTEEGFGDDEHLPVSSWLLRYSPETVFEMIEIIVPEDELPGSDEPKPVPNRGVIEGVGRHPVAGF